MAALQTPTPVISHPGAQLHSARVVCPAAGALPPPCPSPVGDLPSSSPTHAGPCFPQKRIDHLQIRLHSWTLTLFHSLLGACHVLSPPPQRQNNTTITGHQSPFNPFPILSLANCPSKQLHEAKPYAHRSHLYAVGTRHRHYLTPLLCRPPWHVIHQCVSRYAV